MSSLPDSENVRLGTVEYVLVIIIFIKMYLCEMTGTK